MPYGRTFLTLINATAARGFAPKPVIFWRFPKNMTCASGALSLCALPVSASATYSEKTLYQQIGE